MTDKDQVRRFLEDFKVKLEVWGVVFRDDRSKNIQTILDLEISTAFRKQLLKDLEVMDFSQGPLDDKIYGGTAMWVFGKEIENQEKCVELYIKIAMGLAASKVICISFHTAERKMVYPFKSK